ncbi:MAG TPA: hypothetical protein VH105_15900, partial [Burkholderiales bacterium]|nr:hypothetical protein [Burkholderiales bacterium]
MHSPFRFSRSLFLACLTALASAEAQAQLPPPVPKGQEAITPAEPGAETTTPPLPETQNRDAKFQSTYIWQGKPSFNSPYQGPNSLSPNKESSYTWTVT